MLKRRRASSDPGRFADSVRRFRLTIFMLRQTRRLITTTTATCLLTATLAGFGAVPHSARAAAPPADSAKADDKAKAEKKAKKPAEDPEVKMGREAHEEMLRSGLKLVSDPKTLGRG